MRTHHNANALAAAPSWPALLVMQPLEQGQLETSPAIARKQGSVKEKVKGGMTPIVEEMIDKAIRENVATVDPGSEDAYLVAAAKTGDGRKFELLVGRHQGRILRVAQQFTLNLEDAEDTVQQSFQKAFSTWSSLKEFFIFHLVDAYRHKRGPDVAATKAHFTRGADGGVKCGGWTSSATRFAGSRSKP